MKNFTFSERCIVTHIRENDQQDAQFFSINLFKFRHPTDEW